MYSFILFLVITGLQYLFFIWKRSEVRDYQELAKGVADITTLSRRQVYSKSVRFLSNILIMVSKGLWFIIPVILFVNLMVSIIIGTFTHFIVNLF